MGDLVGRLYYRNVESEVFNTEPNLYQYFSINRENGISISSTTTLESDLVQDGFLTYVHDNGNEVLISEFGTERYECTGRCVCEHNIRRSSATAPLITGLKYLVASVSSIVAINIAKNHFEDECVTRMEETCPSHAVLAEVDDCEAFEQGKGIIDEEGVLKKTFECTGQCVQQFYFDLGSTELPSRHEVYGGSDQDIINQLTFFQKRVDMFKCDTLSLTKEVSGDFSAERIKALTHVYEKDRITNEEFVYSIRYSFIHDHLNPFCITKSFAKTKVKKKKMLKNLVSYGVVYMKKKQAALPLCAGHYHARNPSVQCVEVESKV